MSDAIRACPRFRNSAGELEWRRAPTAHFDFDFDFDLAFGVGLAFDYCVRYSAEDAKALGFDVTVIEAATRAIDLGGTADATRKSFAERSITLA